MGMILDSEGRIYTVVRSDGNGCLVVAVAAGWILLQLPVLYPLYMLAEWLVLSKEWHLLFACLPSILILIGWLYIFYKQRWLRVIWGSLWILALSFAIFMIIDDTIWAVAATLAFASIASFALYVWEFARHKWGS